MLFMVRYGLLPSDFLLLWGSLCTAADDKLLMVTDSVGFSLCEECGVMRVVVVIFDCFGSLAKSVYGSTLDTFKACLGNLMLTEPYLFLPRLF